jgi:hypothetical protein
MGYPSSQVRITDEVVGAYLEAVAGYRVGALAHAVKRFSIGDVDGHNNAFPPSGAQLAQQTRLFDEVMQSLEAAPGPKLVSYRIGEEPPAGAVPLGPLSVDFGKGVIDMSKMTPAEKDLVFKHKGLPPADGALPFQPTLKKMGKI